jgi:hypothetical protein
MTHEKLVELTILAVTASANSVAAASIWILKRELKLQTKAFPDESPGDGRNSALGP